MEQVNISKMMDEFFLGVNASMEAFARLLTLESTRRRCAEARLHSQVS